MKRTTLSLVLLAAAFAFAAPSATTAQELAGPADGQGKHTVVKGDTLWDISGRYLNNPFMWPEVWKLNPGIENPNLIYPGEKVVLPGGAVVTVGKKPAATDAGAKGPREKSPFDDESFVDISKTLLVIPDKKDRKVISLDETKKVRIPIATTGSLLEAGFISDNLEEDTTSLAGSPQSERVVFGNGDDVLVFPKPGIKVGDLLVSFRPELDIRHPVTGDEMGALVKTTGLLRVMGESDGYLLCRVQDIRNDVRKNDLAMLYDEPELVYEPVEKNPGLKGEWGYVVAGLDNRKLNAAMYVVYLDLGSADGVKPGDTFEVRRPGGTTRPTIIEVPKDIDRVYVLADIKAEFNEVMAAPEQDLPDVTVGDIQVISVQDHTATAKVVTFVEPVRPGYRAYYKD